MIKHKILCSWVKNVFLGEKMAEQVKSGNKILCEQKSFVIA